MLWWTFRFVLGLSTPPGKTGKREVAGWLLAFWVFGAFRVGLREAQGIPMPLTIDLLKLAFPFVVLAVALAFGMEQLVRTGFLQGKGGQGDAK